MKIDILMYVAMFLTVIICIASFSQTYIAIRKKRNPDYKPFSIRNFSWKILRHITIVELQRSKDYTKEEATIAVDAAGQDWRKDMIGVTKDMKKDVADTMIYIGGQKVNKLVYYIPFFGYLIAIMLYQDKLIKKPLFVLYFVVSMLVLSGCVALMIVGNQ